MTDISNRAYENTAPQTRQQVVDTYFMEHRAKLVDIAAYLDRIDRGRGDLPTDIRDIAFRKAIGLLTDGGDMRAQRILELFSDFSTELPQSAEGMKGAAGAVALSVKSVPGGTNAAGNATTGGAS